MPNRRVSLRNLFWQEGLPQIASVMVLVTIPGLLERYLCASPMSKLYIWTLIWLIACLISLRYLIGNGPLAVASSGWTHSCLMLWDIYTSIGNPCKTGMNDVTLADVVYAGTFVALAIVGSFYFTTHMCKPSLRARESGEDPTREEKA
ncbi:hypothetical protein NU219Hw_g369t1 [Hortaea werneckii]